MSEIPQTGNDPLGILKLHMYRWIGQERYNKTFKFNPVTLEEVECVVKDLSNTNATGDDGINMKIIKDGIEKLGIYILKIVNLSIGEGTFPNIWKLMKIIPNYKTKEVELTSRRFVRYVYCQMSVKYWKNY